MKKVLAMLLALVMVFSLAACGGGDGGNAKAVKKITIVDGEWYGTDPYQQDTWSSVQTLINEPLFSLDPETGALNDSIATGLEVSEDGLTMSFTIPRGKKFPSGEEVLAEDVKASLEYGQPISPYGEGWENIETIDVDNESGKVVFHLSRFSSDLLYYLGECFIGVLDKDQIESKTQDEMMWGAQCYAPYYVASYEPGSYVTLKPNPGFKSDNPYVQNKGAMDIDEITVKFNIDDFTVIEEMKNGTVDYWSEPSPDAIAQFKDTENVATPEKKYPSVIFMELNDSEGRLFEDIRLRQAVALLLDRELYTSKTNGAGEPAYSLITDTMMYFDQTAKDDYVKNYCNDEAKALALIAEAGWADTDGDGYLDKDGKTFEYDLYVSTNAVRATVAQAMQEHLKSYGIKMNTQSIDWNYVDEYLYSDDYEAGIHGLSWMEPILILNCMYEDPTYGNGVDNDYQWFYDRVTECSAEPDDDKRAVMLGELEMENATLWNCIPLCSYVDYIAYNTRLKGVNILSNSFIYWNDLTVD